MMIESNQIPHVAYGHGTTLAPTSLERSKGRLMRASAPPVDMGTVDNSGGNQGGAGGDSGGANNAGPKFDAASFWNESGDGGNGSPPSGESAAPKPPSSGADPAPQGETPAQALAKGIAGLNLGNGVMNDSVIAELGEGKTDAFTKGLNEMGRSAVMESVKAVLPIMKQVADGMRAEFQQMMQEQFGNKQTESDLFAAIPSAKDPAVRPMVDRVMQQSMKHTKGDRAAAIQMTKDMLKVMATNLGDDIGMPPKTPGDSGSLIPSNRNWLEELAGR